jgi:hypothetical protein
MKGRFGFRSGKGHSVGGEFASPDGESPSLTARARD